MRKYAIRTLGEKVPYLWGDAAEIAEKLLAYPGEHPDDPDFRRVRVIEMSGGTGKELTAPEFLEKQ